MTCQNSVAEIVLQKVFGLLEKSKSSDLELFGKFRNFRPHINQAIFQPLQGDIAISFDLVKDSTVSFAEEQLLCFLKRDSYQELLELTSVILGGSAPERVHCYRPGHSSQQMDGSSHYGIKISLFQEQFKL